MALEIFALTEGAGGISFSSLGDDEDVIHSPQCK